MKNLIYILGFIGVLGSTIVSCTPEDKNLNRPTTFNTQGAPAKNLRVGTLGQTIWAVQNVEQVGTFIHYCLEKNNPVEKVNSKLIKKCGIDYKASSNPASKSAAYSVEKWGIKLELSEDGQLINASGELVRGHSTVVYKTISSYLQFKEKSFYYAQTPDQKFKMEIESSGEIGSKIDTFKFVHQAEVEGQASEQSWNLTNLKHELTLLNMGQTFYITSDNVVLDWSSPSCANANGSATAVEEGKKPSIVVFDATIAKSDSPKWTQRITKCGTSRDERKFTSLNFEYLFY